MQIIYEKEAAKHINKMDKPTKQRIKKAIERFVPEESPLPDEIEAINRANKSISENGTIPHDAINWN